MDKDSKQMSVKKAIALNAIAKYSTVLLQLIYMAVLSRLLSPEAFGVIAVMNVFIVFFQLIADMGLGTGVVQNKTLTGYDISCIFSVSVYLGFLLQLLFVGFSFFVAEIYDNGIYVKLGCVLSFSLAFNAFNMIPNAIMLKEKKFFAIAVRTIIITFISYSATIIVAVKGAGVYALTVSSVINAIGIFVWNMWSVRVKFRWKPGFNSVYKIFGYSMYQFGAQTLNYFNRNLDNLLIGKFFSANSLGYYNKAYTLMQYPINYLPGVITPVLHPILSEHQDSREYIYVRYLKLLKVLSLLGCFGAAFCFYASKEIILIAFGRQWDASVLPFAILSISLGLQILTNTIAPIYQSLGNTKLMFRNLIISTVLIVSMIILGVVAGSIIYVSVFVTIAYILNFFITFYILVKIGFEKSYIEFLKNFIFEFVSFGILIIYAQICPILINNSLLSLLFKFISLFSLYIFLLLLSKQYKNLIHI